MIYYNELGMVKVSAELKGFLKRNPYMELNFLIWKFTHFLLTRNPNIHLILILKTIKNTGT